MYALVDEFEFHTRVLAWPVMPMILIGLRVRFPNAHIPSRTIDPIHILYFRGLLFPTVPYGSSFKNI